jgi:hypothetical protein
MKAQQFDLQPYLNSFLDLRDTPPDSQVLEESLSTIEREVSSMRDFLQALVNTHLWKGWEIDPNPYKEIIISVGSEIDRLASLRSEPAYHSKKHMMDVCLMLTYLLKQEEASRDKFLGSPWMTTLNEKWMLLLAAASHDLGHPGLINDVPYQLEQQSLDLLRNLLIASQYSPALINEIGDALAPWILATDHAQYSTLLNRLVTRPPDHQDCLAMLLVEADLASSVLPTRGLELTNRLSQEWAVPYPEKSIALRNQVGYLSFLTSLQFVSPQAVCASIPQILNKSLLQLRSQLP